MITEEEFSIAGPKGQFLFGCVNDFQQDPLGFVTHCAREFGDFVPISFWNRTAYLISDPELIEEALTAQNRRFVKPELLRSPPFQHVFGEGLVTSNGEFWANQRRLIQPAFHRERISRYADIMVEETRNVLSTWRVGQKIDVHAAMSKLTLKIVVRTLFGSSISQEEENTVAACIASLLELYADQLGVAGMLDRLLPTPRRWRYLRAANQLDDIIYRIIHQRARNIENGDNLFSMLQQAKDERGISMSARQLRDEVMTMFLAGHETTASALSWTWLLLAQNANVEKKLGAELEQVLGERAATLPDVSALKYTENVIKESMRLFPPIWSIGRQSTEQVELGRFQIPAGANIIISQWVVHRDSRLFDDALKFQPERWSKPRIEQLPKFAYFPFGGGPRVCIGNIFALTEAILIMSTILQKYRLTLAQETPAPLATMTLRPEGPLTMRIAALSNHHSRSRGKSTRRKKLLLFREGRMIRDPSDRSSR